MKLIVCVKQVPATESMLAVRPDGTDIERSGLTFIVNPYDEFAVEEALRIRERIGTGEVTVVTLRSHAAQKPEAALRTCLAMGADRAVLLSDPAFEDGDSFTTALALAAALRRLSFDLLLFGKQAVDDDEGAVGVQVAELLGIPHVAVVNRLEVDAKARNLVAHRQIEGGIEVVEAPLPVLVTCQKGLNEPRYPSLPGIMKAKQKPLEVLACHTLGLAPDTLGAAGAKLRVVRLELPPPRPPGRLIPGDAETQAKELVRLLHEKEKLI
ncbi:MAG TPA: electron transfer flavoprotein subunit beta/FixA family protein [Nitrospiraceae bacterium]|jgi:electron transfer flavoprotein beta subunit|nr:electron transfer flavoprotein subunit beta/FixA family protein [Nitrospiraceae bacterium]